MNEVKEKVDVCPIRLIQNVIDYLDIKNDLSKDELFDLIINQTPNQKEYVEELEEEVKEVDDLIKQLVGFKLWVKENWNFLF